MLQIPDARRRNACCRAAGPAPLARPLRRSGQAAPGDARLCRRAHGALVSFGQCILQTSVLRDVTLTGFQTQCRCRTIHNQDIFGALMKKAQHDRSVAEKFAAAAKAEVQAASDRAMQASCEAEAKISDLKQTIQEQKEAENQQQLEASRPTW